MTCMLVLVTMNWGGRLSFERGFTDYIRQANEQRFNLLATSLAERYRSEGSWNFLRHNEKQLYRLLLSFEQKDNGEEKLPPQGWRVPFWVFNADNQRIAGSSHPVPREATRTAITLDGKVIGWIVAVPSEKLTRKADINFARQQSRTSWILVALSILLAAVATMLVSRGLLSRVKTLVGATHKLAAGDFSARVTVTHRDELGTLANDFNQLARTLEKNESMRRAFIADVSHELRTPLAVLQGELEAMEDGVRQLTPTALQSLKAEVLALTKLVNDLHQLSLSDLGALSYKKSSINALSVLEQSIAVYRSRFEQKGLHLTAELPSAALVFGDPDRLSQLFNNLLENSLRYTDADSDGLLKVSAVVDKENLTVRWQDSAPGVTDEQMARIFERFYRTELSRNRARGGSGLGLSICWNIVNEHGGHMSARHSPLGGLEITVTLPLISSGTAAVG